MIEVRELQKSFGAQKVLDGVSFRIENGESVVIIGRSGGGKSVLLKHLIGLIQPDAGEVLIDGENIGPLNERQLLRVRRKFGMVFQGAALFDSMSAACGGMNILARRKSPGASPKRWRWWICRARKTKIPTSCRAECGSGWDWRGPSFTNRKLCFMMNRPPAWTR
jgi:ABC-type lipoprotein export system ATPase subunit